MSGRREQIPESAEVRRERMLRMIERNIQFYRDKWAPKMAKNMARDLAGDKGQMAAMREDPEKYLEHLLTEVMQRGFEGLLELFKGK